LKLNDKNNCVVETYLTKEVLKENKKEFGNEFLEIFKSLNLEVVYEKILNLCLKNKNEKGGIREKIKDEKQKEEINQKIKILEKSIRKEKQPDRQLEIIRKIQRLKNNYLK
jgi:hypothetical protein